MSDEARAAFLAGFEAGAAKEWTMAANCARERLAELPPAAQAMMRAALSALEIADFLKEGGGALTNEEDAIEAWEDHEAGALGRRGG